MVVAVLQKNKNKENHQMPPKFGGFCEEKILPPLPPLSEKYPLHLVGVEEGGGGGNLEPRVSPAPCQRLVAGRNSGIMEFLSLKSWDTVCSAHACN